MCQFFSAIVTRTGDIYWHEFTDSHELLIQHFGLREGAGAGRAAANFIRLEFSPIDQKFTDPESYRLRVDESEVPAWFTDEARESTINKLKAIISGMIVSDRRVLLGGSWILTETAEIIESINSRIIFAAGKARGSYNAGDRNAGNCNAGNCNAGHYNAGHYNAGDHNTGNHNAGNCNAGHYNAGHYNAGNCNADDRNAGNCNAGHYNAGHHNAGNYNAGRHNAGGCNAGHYNAGGCNAGDHNTGNYNAGHHNAGNYNAGHHNAGNYNAGSYNSGDHNAGFFCTKSAVPRFFDKRWNGTWGEAAMLIPAINLPTSCEWVPVGGMTDDEKAANPAHTVLGGFLRCVPLPIKKAFPIAWNKLTAAEKRRWLRLPNFDAKKFFECTGVDVRKASTK